MPSPIAISYAWYKTSERVPTVADARPYLGREGSPKLKSVQAIYTTVTGEETSKTQALSLDVRFLADGTVDPNEINDFDLDNPSPRLLKVLNDPNSVWVALDSNPHEIPHGQTVDHEVNRYHIIETNLGIDSILGTFNYATKESPMGAQGYVDTFSGGRTLRVAYFAEMSIDGGGLKSYAVVKAHPDGTETVLLTRLSESAANGYISIFGGGQTLRVATLQETTEPTG